MNTFIPIFRAQHVALLKDTKNIDSRLRLYFPPLMATALKDLTRMQILEWFNGIASYSPAQANACLSLLRTMYAKASEWGLYEGENRAKYITKRPRKSRKRYLHPDEFQRLMTVLKSYPSWLQLYIEMCLTLGNRPGEARAVKWCDLEFFEVNGVWQGRWTKPTTKTDTHSIPIPSVLAAKLSAMSRTGPYVFTGHCSHAPVSATWLFELWSQVREGAGLPDVRLHDLRRTCATYLNNAGANLSVISRGVLNHTNLQTTSIYVQQMQEPVMKALEAHSQALEKMGGIV